MYLNFYKETYDYGIKHSLLSPEMLKLLKKQINIWEKRIYKNENPSKLRLMLRRLKEQINVWIKKN